MKNVLVLCLLFTSFFAYAQIEIPSNDGEAIYRYTGFTLKYNEQYEQAEWVAYELTAREAQGDVDRTDDFREDSRVTTGTASLSDYRGSGFDRGHLAPAGDMSWSVEAMSDSFYFSNMSPQEPWFNRVTWRLLEDVVRDWAIEHESIYIVTGPVLTDGPYNTIGSNEVAVPKYYYKVVLDYTGPDIRAIAFVLSNTRKNLPFSHFAVSVNFVEAITGIDFFPGLEDQLEELLESQADYSSW